MRTISYNETINITERQRGAQGTSGVYGLVDPREPSRVRYVGSSGCMEHRLYSHTHGGGTTPKALWVATLLSQGIRPEMLVIEETPVGAPQSETRMRLENKWVERLGCDLNVHLTPVGHPQSKDSIGKRLHAENRELRNKVASLEHELAELRAFLGATRNTDATLHRVDVLRRSLKCNATQQMSTDSVVCCTGSGVVAPESATFAEMQELA